EEVLNPSPVRELAVEHEGCFGPCATYSVKLSDDGAWEWVERATDSTTTLQTGKTYPSTFSPLFSWLKDHPALYAANANRIRCEDCEILVFRFGLKSGGSVVVRYGNGFQGDDWWALSVVVDSVVAHERSRRPNEPHDHKPAT